MISHGLAETFNPVLQAAQLKFQGFCGGVGCRGAAARRGESPMPPGQFGECVPSCPRRALGLLEVSALLNLYVEYCPDKASVAVRGLVRIASNWEHQPCRAASTNSKKDSAPSESHSPSLPLALVI